MPGVTRGQPVRGVENIRMSSDGRRLMGRIRPLSFVHVPKFFLTLRYSPLRFFLASSACLCIYGRISFTLAGGVHRQAFPELISGGASMA